MVVHGPWTGTTEMHLVSALDELGGRLRPVLCLHENVVTGAADGFSRMALKSTSRGQQQTKVAKQPTAAALLHLGPGLANGIANLHNVSIYVTYAVTMTIPFIFSLLSHFFHSRQDVQGALCV